MCVRARACALVCIIHITTYILSSDILHIHCKIKTSSIDAMPPCLLLSPSNLFQSNTLSNLFKERFASLYFLDLHPFISWDTIPLIVASIYRRSYWRYALSVSTLTPSSIALKIVCFLSQSFLFLFLVIHSIIHFIAN